MSGAQTQNLKNIERMKIEVNKRIEQNLLEIIKVLDDMHRDPEDQSGKSPS